MKRPKFDKTSHLILLAGLVLLIVLNFSTVVNGLGYVIGVFYPFFLGCVFAFLVNIPMNFFETKVFCERKSFKHNLPQGLRRPLSLIVTIVIIAVVVWLAIIYLIPMVTSAIQSLSITLNESFPEWDEKIREFLQKFPNVLAWYEAHVPKDIPFDKLITQGLSFLINGGITSGGLVGLVSQVASTAVNIILAIVTAFYLCVSKERSWGWLTKMLYAIVPRKPAGEIIRFSQSAYDIFHHFITGQCLESCLLGLLVTVVMGGILRVPYATLIALICVICSFIPMFGAFIAGALGAIMILSVAPEKVIIFLIAYICIRLFDDNFMYPHVMGRSIGLPPVLVLLAITIGGALFGLVGMLAFIPVMSIIQKLILRLVDLGLEKRGVEVVEKGAKVEILEEGQKVDVIEPVGENTL